MEWTTTAVSFGQKNQCKHYCEDDPHCVAVYVGSLYAHVCVHYHGKGDDFLDTCDRTNYNGQCFWIQNRVGRRRKTSPTPQPTARLPASVVVEILGSTRNKKCVFQPKTICAADAGNPGKRVNGDREADTFEITREGDKICARRKDATSGWDIHLRLKCSPLPGYDVNDCHCTGILNQYKCNDGLKAFCAHWEECYAKERSFKNGNWPDGCRQRK